MTASLPAVLGPAAVAAPILAACVLLAGGTRLPRVVVDAVALATTLGLAVTGAVLLAAVEERTAVLWLGGWAPTGGAHPVGIALVVDPVAAGLVMLIGLLAAAALLYSWRYFDTVEAHFHGLVLLFCAGMAGDVLTGDLFDMVVFFELMGAVAYALTAYKIEEPRSVQGGLTFGVVNSLGAYLALSGVGLLYARTGQLGLAPMGAAISTAPPDALVVVGVMLVVTGWLVKAAAVPFHFWLADAHAVAPTPVCVLFSGVMAPLGVYGVARVGSVLAPALPALDHVLVVLGCVTAVAGTVMCVLQRHLKRLLAFSTIAHVGVFLVGVGVGAGGSSGWLVYLAGHAGVKAALFLLVGTLLARHGSVDEIDLHGRGRAGDVTDRVVAVLAGLAGLLLAGLPPGGVGLGKGALDEALPWPAVVVVAGTSVVTGAAVLRVTLRVFLGAGPTPARGRDPERTSGEGEERETTGRLRRVPWTMLAAPAAALAGALAVGAVPAVGRLGGLAGDRLADGGNYRAAVLGGAAATPPSEAVTWHVAGVVSGLATAAGALALAVVAVTAHRLPLGVRGTLGRRATRAVVSLERLHSGHVGDYVAWLVLGLAVVGAAVAVPTLA